jgi:hypothetical protein
MPKVAEIEPIARTLRRVTDMMGARRCILGFGLEAEVPRRASLRVALRPDADAAARALPPQRRTLAQMPLAIPSPLRSFARHPHSQD